MEQFNSKYMQRGIHTLTALCAALALGGCSLTPDYVKPDSAAQGKSDKSELPANFYHADGIWTDASPDDAAPKGDWWIIFSDDELNALLQACRDNNPDLAAAFQTVEMAMARARVDQGDLVPHVGFDGSYSRTSLSKNTATSWRADYDTWMAGFGLTWDLDFFGRVRSLIGSDTAEAQAVMAAYENTLLMLQSEVAQTYFTIRQNNSELKLLEETAEIRQKQVDYFANKLKSGVITDLDMKRAEQLLYEAQSQYEAVKLQKALYTDYLALLTGRIPSQIKATTLTIGEAVPAVPKAIPSEILQRRPDVAAAERRVFAANARIGAARAAYFPTVALSASSDLVSADIDTLLNSSSLAWGVSPKVYIPIFQGGKLMAQEEIAIAEHRQVVELYRSSVLRAFREVEDSLASMKYLEREYSYRSKASTSAHEVLDLTIKRHDAGVVDYYEVTDAQRISLLNDRETLRIKGDRFRACVSLITSLGGGWYRTPDFEADDKRSDTEKVLALPTEIFSDIDPNTQEYKDTIKKQKL